MFLPFLAPLTFALLLAIMAHSFHEWLRRRVRRKSLAAALAVFLIAVTIVVPVTFVTRLVAHEAIESMQELRGNLAQGQWRDAIDRSPRLASLFEWIGKKVNVAEQIDRASEKIVEGAQTFASESLYFAAGLLIALFLLFYFFRDQDAMLNALRSLMPLSAPETDTIFSTVRNTIHGVSYGTLLVALVQGALGGLIFWWLDLPAPIVWGTAMALLAILPVMGAALIWAPAAIFLALDGDWHKALILTAWGGIVIALIDNLLYPLLVKGKMRLHTVPVFIAILGGLVFFGASGLVLGPVVLAISVALLEIWRRRLEDQHSPVQ